MSRSDAKRHLLLRRQLNKLRWLSLSLVFVTLVLLPLLSIYQNYTAAHAYDLLEPGQKQLYDVMEWLTGAFTDDPATDLNAVKGTTWSASLFGYKISDPLAVVSQIAASLTLYWPFVLTALVPLVASMLLGRIYCGWICPATFLYELNDNLGSWLRRAGIQLPDRVLWRPLKYLVLATGLVLAAITGSVVTAAIYPPAIIGRELYYGIALGGFGAGAVFFLLTLLFDHLVARRGFCRYLCPGGALYSLLGRFRVLRIQRDVANCNDCTKCNAACQFGLDPMGDGFGQECNNCSACISACPTDALLFKLRINDLPAQGPGHLGHAYRKQRHVSRDENQAA